MPPETAADPAVDVPLPLHRTIPLGDFRLHLIEAGTQLQDGGAIFGIVPRPRWSGIHPPDEMNRIPLALRCLLVETPDELVLVDTGVGSKPDARLRAANGVSNTVGPGEGGADLLETAIVSLGFAPFDVTTVINTHLHFDHAGGNTKQADDAIEPAFPRARFIVQSGEWEEAHRRNERAAAAYLARDLDILLRRGCISFVDGAAEIVRGISVLPTPGHTAYHQSVIITSNGDTACFAGDVLPTATHLPPAWTMAFDVEPLMTMETKRGLVQRAVDEAWIMVTSHDPRYSAGRIVLDGSRTRYLPI